VNLLQAALLGVVEGLTEFLPVSSTGHLTVAEQLLGLPPGDAGITAFTALVQLGAIAAVVLYFARDIAALATAWVRGLADPAARSAVEYRLAWYVVAGSVPIGVVGFAARGVVAGPLRNLWVVAVALIAWSAIMYVAELVATQKRAEGDIRIRDALVVGAAQCIALVPGVSRSGATISAGLIMGLDRTTATRFSFLLSIPALVAAGAYEGVTAAGDVSASVGWGPTALAAVVAFVVAFGTIGWLLRLVARYPITVFIAYRVVLGGLLLAALGAGLLSAS
jgi:undecaprenyl-diphosphatase